MRLGQSFSTLSPIQRFCLPDETAARHRTTVSIERHHGPVREASVFVVVAAVAATAVSGCSASPAPARAVADRFYRSVEASDWSAACTYLAPDTRAELVQSTGKPCPAALASEAPSAPGAVGRSVEYGTMTQVRYQQDTVFLARFQTGWKVMAAGCSPVAGHPYDCQLQGR